MVWRKKRYIFTIVIALCTSEVGNAHPDRDDAAIGPITFAEPGAGPAPRWMTDGDGVGVGSPFEWPDDFRKSRPPVFAGHHPRQDSPVLRLVTGYLPDKPALPLPPDDTDSDPAKQLSFGGSGGGTGGNGGVQTYLPVGGGNGGGGTVTVPPDSLPPPGPRPISGLPPIAGLPDTGGSGPTGTQPIVLVSDPPTTPPSVPEPIGVAPVVFAMMFLRRQRD